MDHRTDCAPARLSRASIACAALFALALANCGCSLFHHGETSQQKFIEALQRGNGPEANQIWLHMNEKERADWSHSIGIKPNISKQNLQAQVIRHFQEKAAEADGTDATGGPDGSSPNVIEEGDIDSQMIEMPGLDADPAASLQSLPGLAAPDGTAAPEITTIPQ